MRVKTLIVGLLLATGLWIVLPYIFIILNEYFDWPTLNFPVLKALGSALIVSAMMVDIYLLGLFKQFGKGTPVPIEPTNNLIFKGLYKRSRNPMYLGHLIVYLGLFLYFGYLTLLGLFFLAAIGLHLLVTKWEEPGLKDRLGKEYFEYLKKVPRWL